MGLLRILYYGGIASPAGSPQNPPASKPHRILYLINIEFSAILCNYPTNYYIFVKFVCLF